MDRLREFFASHEVETSNAFKALGPIIALAPFIAIPVSGVIFALTRSEAALNALENSWQNSGGAIAIGLAATALGYAIEAAVNSREK